MTVLDLDSIGGEIFDVSCDVCIVGAGAAGLYLADRLSRRGQSVVILEAGGRVCHDGNRLGMNPAFPLDLYKGATEGRAFGLGGSTSRWGGLLIPHSAHDIRDGEAEDTCTWRHIVSVVRKNSNEVLATLGFDHEENFDSLPEKKIPDVVRASRSGGLEILAGEFLPFGRRNLSHLVAGNSGKRGRLRIFLNAVASSWTINPGSSGPARVRSVGAVSRNRNRVCVEARQFVVASGAIESARILLEVNDAGGGAVFPSTAAIGSCLSDHLSCKIADVAPADRDRIAALLGPKFSRGRLRSFRFVESEAKPPAPRGFAHFIFEIDNPSFRLAKGVLLSLQSRRLPKIEFTELIEGLGGLVQFSFDRYVSQILHIPTGTPAHLQLDIEQMPTADNEVSLGNDRDAFGRRVPMVRWRVSEADKENIRRTAERLLRKWPGESAGLPDLIPVLNGGVTKPHDAYHPVGTCRMGSDSEAVVDLDLRARGTRNLWVLSTAVFPSAGTANPTFSMLCLGEELTEHLAKSL